MCGICGEFRFEDGAGLSDSEFGHLTRMMALRGPDSEGLWSDDRHCRLGFRRLAILDLSPAGDQPMLTPDSRYALVFNGEIYNFAELRHELSQAGVGFRSTGDTEVVLQALAHWGEKALDRFNGMFALGFYDRAERSLLLARDHAGIKPLYYMLGRDGIFFASQYDQILAHPWREGLPVSATGLGLFLRLGYIPAPHAILEQTHMLEPGSWLRVTHEGRLSRGSYYTFPVFRRPELSGEAANEAVDAAVSAAVKRQMVSDVPLGAFLSGGIDSPLVTAKMQAGATRRIRAYTIGSAGSPFDESLDAAAYADELGVDQVLEQFTPDQALDWLDRVTAACGEPFADQSIFPTMLVSHLARRDLTVALSGDGGDELFWGYAERFGSILRRAADFRQSYWLRSARWGARRAVGQGTAHGYLRWPTIGDWQREKHSLILPGWLASVFEEPPPWPSQMTLYDFDGWEPDDTAQWLRWNEFVGHLAKVLLKVDRASMANSLEVRVPLLDREVIDIATRVDWRACLDLRTGIGKLPLRSALSRHVRMQTTKKRGFQVPMAEWFRGPLGEVFRDTMLDRRELLGIELNRSGLEQLLSDHVSCRAEMSRGLWTLLSLGLWSDRHFQPAAVSLAAS